MAKALLKELGECSYNGFKFNNSVYTTDVSIRGIPDGSGRFITQCEWSLTLEWELIATPGQKTDKIIADALARLSEPGKEFRYAGRGLGLGAGINLPATPDLKWGPTPGKISVQMLGEGNIARLKWPVTFRRPCCANGTYDGRISELVYSVEFLSDDAGYSDRTISGYFVIPLAAQASGVLRDSALNYWPDVIPPLLRGFKRTFGPRRLSEDRTRLDWTIHDSELGGEPLPRYIAEASVSEDVTSGEKGLMSWTGTIDAEYRLTKRAPSEAGAKAFFEYLDERLKDINKSLKDQNQKYEIIPIAFRARNPNRYGRPAASFSLSYTYTCALKSLMQTSGLFQPVDIPGNTWDAWIDSVADSALAPYGASRVTFLASDDVHPSLCDPAVLQTRQLQSFTPPDLQFGPDQAVEKQTNTLVGGQFLKLFPKPSPGTSWLGYEVEIAVETDNGVVPVRLLPLAPLLPASDLFGSVADVAGAVIDAVKMKVMPDKSNGVSSTTPPATPPTGTLRRVKANCVIFFRGYAVRAAFPVEPPRLLTLNGQECIPANRLDRGEGFTKGIKQNAANALHWCRWNFRYILPEVPTTPIQVPVNPMQGVAAT